MEFLTASLSFLSGQFPPFCADFSLTFAFPEEGGGGVGEILTLGVENPHLWLGGF